jgi:hypothetical protein
MRANMNKYATNLSSALGNSNQNSLGGVDIEGVLATGIRDKFKTAVP